MSQREHEHRRRLQTSYADWLKHRAILEAYRVRPGDRRTTPPPAYNISELCPELAERSATTVRLHPRYGDEPPANASKMGGTFLWPDREPWPVCPAHQIPLVTVLQLRAEDFPEMPFPPGADLFQVLWCPREHHDVPECRDKPCPMYWADPRFYWRNGREISGPWPDNPAPQEADYEYVPFPCRLLPERVTEFPSVYDLPEDLADRVSQLADQPLGPDGAHACDYEGELSVAVGTKIGGYVHWIQFPWVPACECGRTMEHLLTIATVEWDGIVDRRWTPLEEQAVFASFPGTWDQWDEERKAIQSALWGPTGLSLGDGGQMQLFVCRHCGRWPIVANIECC
jgi:hypothetical protein